MYIYSSQTMLHIGIVKVCSRNSLNCERSAENVLVSKVFCLPYFNLDLFFLEPTENSTPKSSHITSSMHSLQSQPLHTYSASRLPHKTFQNERNISKIYRDRNKTALFVKNYGSQNMAILCG